MAELHAQDTLKAGIQTVKVLEEPKSLFENPFFNTIIGVLIGTFLTILGALIQEWRQKKREAFQSRENKIFQLNSIKAHADSLIHSITVLAAGLMEAHEIEKVNISHGAGLTQQSINNRLAAQTEYYKVQAEFIKQVYFFIAVSKEEALFNNDLFIFRHTLLEGKLDRTKYSRFDSYIEDALISRSVQPILNNFNQVIMKLEKQ
jgi:hypothetical protein